MLVVGVVVVVVVVVIVVVVVVGLVVVVVGLVVVMVVVKQQIKQILNAWRLLVGQDCMHTSRSPPNLKSF